MIYDAGMYDRGGGVYHTYVLYICMIEEAYIYKMISDACMYDRGGLYV